MADINSDSSQWFPPIITIKISNYQALPLPPTSLNLSYTSQSLRKVEGIAVVTDNLEERLMAAFTFLMLCEDPFKLKKVLQKSDVDGSCRLLLGRNWVEHYILPMMDPHEAQLCRTTEGKQFPVLDVDDESIHSLVLKKWKNSYFVLTGNWVPNFVVRKHLEVGDQVGFALFNGHFFFKLLKKKRISNKYLV